MIISNKKNKIVQVIKNGEVAAEYNIKQTGIINTIETIMGTVEDIITTLGEIDYYENFLIDMYNNKNIEIVERNIEKITNISIKYIDEVICHNYKDFITMKKVTSSTILVNEEEIRQLLILSATLKLLIPIYSADYIITSNMRKEIFRLIINRQNLNSLLKKIFQIVKGKIFKFSIDDKFMWEMMKIKSTMDDKTFSIYVFEFMTNAIIVMCDLTKNPIKYLSATIGDQTRWYLKDIYTEAIVHKEGSVILTNVGIDISRSVIYEDKLLKIEKYVVEKLQERNIDVFKLEETIKEHGKSNNFLNLFVKPLVSRMCSINYDDLNKFSLDKQYKLQLFLYFMFEDYSFQEKILFLPLLRSIITNTKKSSYRAKNMKVFSKNISFWGLNNKTLVYNILSKIVSVFQKGSVIDLFNKSFSLSDIDHLKMEENILIYLSKIMNDDDDVIRSFKKKINTILYV